MANLENIRHVATPIMLVRLVGGLIIPGLLYSVWSLVRSDGPLPRQIHAVPAPLSTLHLSENFTETAYCKGIPSAENITVIVKTGATEAFDKLPTQLITSLRCVPDPILVSDLEQTLGQHAIHDVIARVLPEAMNRNPDFEIYHKQQELVSSGRGAELKTLSSIPIATKDWRTPGKSAAWGLDKYKFLHEVELAWELQPDRDWYVFIEADTYLFWRNLHTFLLDYDPKQPWYLGSPVRMYEHPTPLWFAYGGAGFILSGAVVRDWMVNHPGMANEWDTLIVKMWFGDYVMADALDEKLGVHVTDATPMMHPDEPVIVPFGEHLWCMPIVTLHHLDSRKFDEVYHTELMHNGTALLFRDLYHSTYTLGIPNKRDDWDNLAHDGKYAIEIVLDGVDETNGQGELEDLDNPHKSYQECELACTRNEACFQFTFTILTNTTGAEPVRTTACHLSGVFRLGFERKQETWGENNTWVKKWMSGWRSDRIAKWVHDHRHCPIP